MKKINHHILRLFLAIVLMSVTNSVSAQIGEHRNTFAVGGNAGYILSNVGFVPTVAQGFHGGPTVGFSWRYTCEKYFSTICSIYGEVNYASTGWKENIVDINDVKVVDLTTGNPQEYSRTINYVQVPVMAHLAWGKENRGYTYDQLTDAAAKAMVTNASCGAGATLSVSDDAGVSSSCDGDDPGPGPGPDPQPVVSDFWNISDDDFKFLGTITTETTVRGLTIAASADKAMTVSESAKTIDGKSFTHVLKTGGSGSAAARHLRFAVSGSCTIEVYLISANTSSERVLNIYSGSYGGDPLTTMPAATTAAKQTYNYTGGATTIYMGSANSGINFYGISVQYPTPTDIDNVQNESAARKVLRHGQVLILWEDATYDLFGRRVD